MTPEEARQLLDGATPAPWEHSNPDGITEISASGKAIAADANPEDAPLITAAPDMAAMIANMTAEYAVQLADGRLVGAGWGTRETAECDRDAWQKDGYNARIVCRFVTDRQPLGEEQ